MKPTRLRCEREDERDLAIAVLHEVKSWKKVEPIGIFEGDLENRLKVQFCKGRGGEYVIFIQHHQEGLQVEMHNSVRYINLEPTEVYRGRSEHIKTAFNALTLYYSTISRSKGMDYQGTWKTDILTAIFPQ